MDDLEHPVDPAGKIAASVLQRKVASGEFDVFLCHNHRDKPAVKQVGEALKKQGVLPWLDEWELRPGLRWQSALEQQIGQVKSAAVFVGAEGIGPWQNEELDAFLCTFVDLKRPVIPVLLRTAPHEPDLPVFLRGRTYVDFRASDPDPMAQLLWGITGKRAQPGAITPEPPPPEFTKREPAVSFPQSLIGSWQIRIHSPTGIMITMLLQIYPNGAFQGQLATPFGMTNVEGGWRGDATGGLYLEGRQYMGFQVIPYLTVLRLTQTAPLQMTGMTMAGEQTIWQKVG